MGQLDQVQYLLHPHRAVGFAPFVQLERVLDVLRDVHVREQRVVLEHEADVARLHVEPGDVGAPDQDAPGRRLGEPGDGTQQRRLAGAGRAEERAELAAGNVQVGRLQADMAVRECQREPVDGDAVGRRGMGLAVGGPALRNLVNCHALPFI